MRHPEGDWQLGLGGVPGSGSLLGTERPFDNYLLKDSKDGPQLCHLCAFDRTDHKLGADSKEEI